ncbi:inositol monophosphatase 1 isoform X2 [Anabrus simplex]|uniref:inositol monophosphatase 1 isoform X2 n=1 Tax=Anabrus simplex TaxID=316456 RepID=UPI0035A2F8A1
MLGVKRSIKTVCSWNEDTSCEPNENQETTMCTEAEMANYLEVAEEIAREAGKLILEGFSAAKDVTTKNGPWDLVTEYDRKVENLAFAELKKKFPTHKFIGEESEAIKEVSTELTDDPTWIIDPIDGTTNFIHGFHETCISMGLSVKKELIVGVVYNPILDYMFKARKGHGAYLNNKRIYTSKCTEMKDSLIAMETSFARIPEHRETVLARLRGIVTKAHAIRSVGTGALSMCYVANGSLDAYHIDGLYSWDVAAGAVIIREAGGVVMDTSGGPFELMSRKVLVAANKTLADELVQVIKIADATITK